uniref:(northern house mosquito) hypothetical protein n=1 Tax=Culex pipiens TaxID=7175 RepID=A0A8D8KBK3_CULPI
MLSSADVMSHTFDCVGVSSWSTSPGVVKTDIGIWRASLAEMLARVALVELIPIIGLIRSHHTPFTASATIVDHSSIMLFLVWLRIICLCCSIDKIDFRTFEIAKVLN